MSIELNILGSGSATPTPGRNPSGQFLKIADAHILIDCGEGTQMQLSRFGLKASKIQAIFITHLHGDHYFGLPGLLSSLHLNGRTAALHLYGPPELEEILQIQFRVSDTELRYPLHFHPISASQGGLLAEFGSFTVESFPLAHRIPCTGYIFREKARPRNLRKDVQEKYPIPHDKIKEIKAGADLVLPNGGVIPNAELTLDPVPPVSYAYCSDTGPNPEMHPFIQGVDWLYHEATFAHELLQRARDTFHSTAVEAAETAKQIGAKHLLIGHFSSRYKDVTPLVEEARAIFPDTIAVSDGMQLELS